MKKILLLLIACLLYQQASFADGSTVKRKWCGGVFHRKFVATAKTSALSWKQYQNGIDCSGRHVGTQKFYSWNKICENSSKGCSRPLTASCGPNSGTINDVYYSGCYGLIYPNPYYAYSKVHYTTSGAQYTFQSSGRGSAGSTDSGKLNPEIFDSLNDKGSSQGDIVGDADIDNENNLVISNLTGQLTITRGADYFATLKFFVIKEDTNISDDEAIANENAIYNGDYSNVVFSGNILLNKNGVSYNGFLKSNHNGVENFLNDSLVGITLNNINMAIPINANLKDNEALTLITIVDGGFDISSAIVDSLDTRNKPTSILNSNNNSLEKFNIYPNPSNGLISLSIYSQTDNNSAEIEFYNVEGRKVKKLKLSGLSKGINQIAKIDVSDVAKGPIFIKADMGNGPKYHKTVILK